MTTKNSPVIRKSMKPEIKEVEGNIKNAETQAIVIWITVNGDALDFSAGQKFPAWQVASKQPQSRLKLGEITSCRIVRPFPEPENPRFVIGQVARYYRQKLTPARLAHMMQRLCHTIQFAHIEEIAISCPPGAEWDEFVEAIKAQNWPVFLTTIYLYAPKD